MNVEYSNVNKSIEEIDITFTFECFAIEVDYVNVCQFSPVGGFDLHTHSNYEIHYIKKGRGIVVLLDKEYQLEAGDFYLTGPGVLHKQISDSDDPMVEYALKCSIKADNSMTNVQISLKNEMECLMNIIDNKAFGIVKDRCDTGSLFENIFEEVSKKRPGYFIEIKLAIYRIIIATARNYSDSCSTEYFVPKRDLNSYRIQNIKTYIADNYNKNISCEELAAHMFLSRRQLSRILQAETGYSVYDFVMSEKIEIIKKLLISTDHKLTTIAERTGFSSEYHLSNTFKKWVGISPARYRVEKAASNDTGYSQL